MEYEIPTAPYTDPIFASVPFLSCYEPQLEPVLYIEYLFLFFAKDLFMFGDYQGARTLAASRIKRKVDSDDDEEDIPLSARKKTKKESTKTKKKKRKHSDDDEDEESDEVSVHRNPQTLSLAGETAGQKFVREIQFS